MHWHWQNLNERPGNRTGSPLRHGRAWLNISHATGLEWEWCLLDWQFRLELDLATHDHAFTIAISLFLFTFYLSVNWPLLYTFLEYVTKRPEARYGNGREIGVYWFDGDLVINLWEDPMEGHHDDPKWWHFRLTPKDILLGHPEHSERTISTDRVEIPMPEGVYTGTVKIFESTWKRPRWPWPTRLVRSTITPDRPIPFPGKGENSWDCGEDATHNMTCAADTPLKAVVAMVESTLRDRYRHGGMMWRPAPQVVDR